MLSTFLYPLTNRVWTLLTWAKLPWLLAAWPAWPSAWLLGGWDWSGLRRPTGWQLCRLLLIRGLVRVAEVRCAETGWDVRTVRDGLRLARGPGYQRLVRRAQYDAWGETLTDEGFGPWWLLPGVPETLFTLCTVTFLSRVILHEVVTLRVSGAP